MVNPVQNLGASSSLGLDPRDEDRAIRSNSSQTAGRFAPGFPLLSLARAGKHGKDVCAAYSGAELSPALLVSVSKRILLNLTKYGAFCKAGRYGQAACRSRSAAFCGKIKKSRFFQFFFILSKANFTAVQ
jgi:hypothetical protein